MAEKTIKETIIAAADLGSSKISLAVARVSEGNTQMQFYREWPSEGIRDGMVTNPPKVARVLKKAIDTVRSELQLNILQMVVNLPKYGVMQQTAEHTVQRSNPDECITQQEVDNIKGMAMDSYSLDDPDHEQIYAAIVQSFSDDESFQLSEEDIVGEMSSTLKGNFKILIGRRSSIKALEMVFNSLNIALTRTYFSPCTIHKAVLSDEEMENGVALLDFGGGVTSMAIYQKNILRHYAAVPYGGKVVTSDIKTECSVSPELAENIKLAFGACLPDKLANMDEKIIQVEDLDIEDFKQIPVKYLSEIINSREMEIVDALLFEISESGYANKLRSGIVITGGGAKVTNLANLIREMSGYTVRLGMPRHLFNADDCPEVHTPSATNAVGLVLAAKDDPHVVSCVDRPKRVVAKKAVETPAAEPETVEPQETIRSVPEAPVTDNVETKGKGKGKKPGFWKKIGTGIGHMYDRAGEEEGTETV